MSPHTLAVAVLALPVLVEVYARAALRPRPALRLGATAIGIIAATAALTLLQPTPSTATGGSSTDDATLDRARAAAVDGASTPTFVPLVLAAVPDTSVEVVHEPRRDDPTGEALVAAAVPAPPDVVRFRPRHGTRDVAAPLEVSVRFTEAMDRSSARRAFKVVVDGTPWSGRARWAEGDTVLVLRLARRLPAGARVRLSVARTARSAAGVPLASAAKATFTIAEPPATPRPTTRATDRPKAAATPRPSATGWSWPLIGRITQRFGESLTKYGFHQGIDIDGDTGDRVRAARAGRVTLAGYGDSCGGIQVQIDHGDGIATWYRHLSALSVRKGERVERGEVVGRVGNTGCSLGSHLHFAVRRNGDFVDPLRYLPRR